METGQKCNTKIAPFLLLCKVERLAYPKLQSTMPNDCRWWSVSSPTQSSVTMVRFISPPRSTWLEPGCSVLAECWMWVNQCQVYVNCYGQSYYAVQWECVIIKREKSVQALLILRVGQLFPPIPWPVFQKLDSYSWAVRAFWAHGNLVNIAFLEYKRCTSRPSLFTNWSIKQ